MLDRLRRDEREWRVMRWSHLATGVVVLGGNGYLLSRQHALMQSVAEMLDGSNLREAAHTIYLVGIAAVLFGASLVYGFYELTLALRRWNGDPVRQGVIACLEAHTDPTSSTRG